MLGKSCCFDPRQETINQSAISRSAHRTSSGNEMTDRITTDGDNNRTLRLCDDFLYAGCAYCQNNVVPTYLINNYEMPQKVKLCI